jgi:hypothetical protein
MVVVPTTAKQPWVKPRVKCDFYFNKTGLNDGNITG